MSDRGALAQAFLDRAGWGNARRAFLAGDASARRYDRLHDRHGETAVLMDAPPEKGEDVGAFARIDAHLLSLGLSAPQIITADASNGFLLLEDLGDDLYARVIPATPSLETPLYAAATDVLAHLQARAPAADLPPYGAREMVDAVSPATDWYAFAITGARSDLAALQAPLADLLAKVDTDPHVMILRDYHAENLLWLPKREGIARVGLLDFQMAMLSSPAVDLVSLLQDARRDVPPAVEEAMIRRFVALTGRDEAAFRMAYAVVGAQRHLRILGIFARLSLHFGKPGYVDLIPRVWRDLQRDLAHPALASLARAVETQLPMPTAETLQRIRDQCGTIPTP
jgi:N-acetylmuramate 1-kinase